MLDQMEYILDVDISIIYTYKTNNIFIPLRVSALGY